MLDHQKAIGDPAYLDCRNNVLVSFSMLSDNLQLGHLNVYHIENKNHDVDVSLTFTGV